MVADLYGDVPLAATAAPTWRAAGPWPYLPGMLVAGAVALAAAWLADHYTVPLVLMGLLVGLALSFLSQDARTHRGLDWLSQTGLRIGIVLLAARITTDQLMTLGIWPFVLLVGIMLLVILVTLASARWFGQSRDSALLAGGATAICGASAALAIYGLLGRDRVDQTRFTVTLVGITLASAMAMTIYPLLAKTLGLSDAQAGFLIGASIHDVAQALGGGFSVSNAAGEVATIVKLTRVALLAPMLMLMALWLNRAGAAGVGAVPLALPWFIIAFVLGVALNSLVAVPAPWRSTAASGAQIMLLLAIIATAMKARLHLIMGQGWRSFAPVMVATATSFLLALGGAMLL